MNTKFSFLKAFESSPAPCYYLSQEGDFWKNTAAREHEDHPETDRLVEQLMNALADEMANSATPGDVPHLGAAARLRGLTVLPLEGGLLAVLSDVAQPPITALSAGLREPLTNIFLTLPLLAKQMDGEGGAYLESVAANSYTLLRLANNLENAAAVQRASRLKTIDLRELVRSLADSAIALCKGQGIPISLSLPDEPLPVRADPHLLGEAFLNVLRNSLQFTRDDNRIKISLSVLGKRAVLKVSDQGMGIQPEIVSRIFEPYFSCDPYADGAPRPGLGLGLSVARDVLKGIGGTITCESAFGEGTQITMAMPLDEAGGDMLGSSTADYITNRYSPVYVQLSGYCRLPELNAP